MSLSSSYSDLQLFPFLNIQLDHKNKKKKKQIIIVDQLNSMIGERSQSNLHIENSTIYKAYHS